MVTVAPTTAVWTLQERHAGPGTLAHMFSPELRSRVTARDYERPRETDLRDVRCGSGIFSTIRPVSSPKS
jgi:hypothetical protein